MAITTKTTLIVMPALAPTLRPEDFELDDAVALGAGAMVDGIEYMVEYDPVAMSKGMDVNVDTDGLFVGVDEAVVIICVTGETKDDADVELGADDESVAPGVWSIGVIVVVIDSEALCLGNSCPATASRTLARALLILGPT